MADHGRTQRRPPSPFLGMFLPVVAALILNAIVDALVVVPMVEIDPALTIQSRATPAVAAIRGWLPSVASVVTAFGGAIIASLAAHRELRRDLTGLRSRVLVLRSPRIFGTIAAGVWLVALAIGLSIDLATLTFPVPGEAAAYYVSSILAISSTAVFGLFVTYLIVDLAVRIIYVPAVFPDGFVSRTPGIRRAGVAARTMMLWFAVSFFPMLVLGLGAFTRRYVPENELRAYGFIAVFLPAAAVLAWFVGRSIQAPLSRLVEATQRIAAGSFELAIRSSANDDVGYLIDSTVDMANALEEKQRITEMFGRSVDPRVRDLLISSSFDGIGRRTHAVVMFCDIRGFTTFSEHNREEDVVALLNEHFSEMERVIQRHGGMINKFLGDGFLALFGIPVPIEQPEVAALRCSVDLARAHRALNQRRVERGESVMRIGVGIHAGTVISGTVGSPTRLEYTVIGDTVNLASRVQDMTKQLKATILVTGAVQQGADADRCAADGIVFRTLGEHPVRGRQRPVELFAVGTRRPSPEERPPQEQDGALIRSNQP